MVVGVWLPMDMAGQGFRSGMARGYHVCAVCYGLLPSKHGGRDAEEDVRPGVGGMGESDAVCPLPWNILTHLSLIPILDRIHVPSGYFPQLQSFRVTSRQRSRCSEHSGLENVNTLSIASLGDSVF